MGKPFEKELTRIKTAVTWSFSIPLNLQLQNLVDAMIQYPLIVVGSGGSFSGSHFVARVHEQISGKISRAVTPLEFIFSDVDPTQHAVLFISAGGNNKDIIDALKKSIQLEFAAIGVICAQINSKISRIAKLYPHIQSYEYINPTGKDGFLAVNSLLSTCILVARAYGSLDSSTNSIENLFILNPDFSAGRWNSVFQRRTLVALGAGWAWPALVDLESKFTEAGLGNILISDFRNFAHGRHNWFDKKGDESALIVLETKSMSNLSHRTLDLIPDQYPKEILTSPFDGPMACLHFYIQIFHVVDEAGRRLNVDPGKPKVPEFGRKIYHIGLAPAISPRLKGNRMAWIQRKIRASAELYPSVEESLTKFLEELRDTKFPGIVFDYDGTLCGLSDRFEQPVEKISVALNNLLSSDIYIGIATGRGKSAQMNLKKIIDKKYWGRVLVGNYNGAIILPLNDELPNMEELTSNTLKQAEDLLQKDLLLKKYVNIETRAKQISISFLSVTHKQSLLNRILEIINDLECLKIVQSEHSIDILDTTISKLKLVDSLRTLIGRDKGKILVIGDQGQLGGNDFEMLNQPYSLSVNKVSTSLTTCWNLAPDGLRGFKATLAILRSIKSECGGFFLDIDLLEKEMTA